MPFIDPKPFISQLVQCVDQEERAVAEIVGRLRENPFSENAIDRNATVPPPTPVEASPSVYDGIVNSWYGKLQAAGKQIGRAHV